MSKIEVDAIDKQSGSTLTIGGSGTTVQLGTGASQTGFGREGSVNWQTGSIKTTTFTATSGEGYFVDTSSGAVTVNLPAGSAGAIVAINDYAQTAATNKITVSANGSEKIEAATNNKEISTNGVTVTLVYVDGTRGWKLVDTGEIASFPTEALFTTATGGSTADCGNFRIHTFTGPGTFCVSQVGNSPSNPGGGPNTVSYMVVAGGGGAQGGGAGGGGFREGRDISPSYTASPLVAPAGLTITATGFPITVGAGGSGSGSGNRGSNSIFSTITSTGGGGSYWDAAGQPGGSGSGGSKDNTPGTYPGGSGNTPSVSPPQGNNGGTANNSSQTSAGGGGAGGNGAGTPGPGNGGCGVATSITGSPVT